MLKDADLCRIDTEIANLFASYGTLCSFAKHLDLDEEVIDLLKESLKEETAADKKLTKVAEGTFFSTGVNEEAVETASFVKAGKKG